MSATTPNMDLTYPEYNDPQFVWAQLLENIRNRLSTHDHNITNKTGLPIDTDSIICNNNIYFEPNNDITLGSINFNPENVISVFNAPSTINSLYVKDKDIYFTDGLNREIQLTSGGQLNQLTVFGGGFSGDFVTSGASVVYIGGLYAFLGSATQPTPFSSILISDNFQTQDFLLPYLNITTVVTVTNRSDFFDANFGFGYNPLPPNRFSGFGSYTPSSVLWPTWIGINGEAGFAYSNYLGVRITSFLSCTSLSSATYQFYETGFKTKDYRVEAYLGQGLLCGMLEALANGTEETAQLNFVEDSSFVRFFGIYGCYGTEYSLNNGYPLVINQSTTPGNYSTTYNMKNGISTEGTGFLFFNSVVI